MVKSLAQILRPMTCMACPAVCSVVLFRCTAVLCGYKLKRQDIYMSTIKSEIDINISRRFKMARNFAGMEQDAAAYLLSVSVVTLSRYENGKRSAPDDTVKKMSSVYGVSLTWLLTGEGPMQELHHVATGGAVGGGTADIDAHHTTTPAHPSGPDPPPPPDQEDDDKLPTAPQAIEMTREVLASRTIYRGALLQNIKAFHRAVQGEQEMSSLRDDMQDMKKQMAAMQAMMERIERNTAVIPATTPAKKERFKVVEGGKAHHLTYTENKKVSLRGNTERQVGIYTYAEAENVVFVGCRG